MLNYLAPTRLTAASSVPELSEPSCGHALAHLAAAVSGALAARWGVPVEEHRPGPLVSVRDNYDRPCFSLDNVTRDSRYSRHVSPTVMLRSHTSAGMPAVLPGARWRAVPSIHPHTSTGVQLDVHVRGGRLELAAAGLVAAGLVAAGLVVAGLVAAGVPGMTVMSPVRRDLSLVCPDDVDAEVLGDAARSALGADADVLARLEMLAVTSSQANKVRNRVYLALHDGPELELIAG